MAATPDNVGANHDTPQSHLAVESCARGIHCEDDTKTCSQRWIFGCGTLDLCCILFAAEVLVLEVNRAVLPRWGVPPLDAADCYLGTCLVALACCWLYRYGHSRNGDVGTQLGIGNNLKGSSPTVHNNMRDGSDELAASSEQQLNFAVEQAAKKFGVVEAGQLIMHFEGQDGICTAPLASYESVLRACARYGDSNAAHMWFSRMISKGSEARATTYKLVLDAYVKADDVVGCEAWLEHMLEKNVEVNTVTYSAAICARARHGETMLAEAWFQRMRAAGIEADAICYNSLIHSCSIQRDVHGAERWAEEMWTLGLKPTVTTYTTLIGACAKCGQILRAEFWMERMVDQGLKPHVVSFVALMDACVKPGNPKRAVHWYETMISIGVSPNSHTYASVISAFAQVGDVASAEAWLDRFERDENCDSRDVVVYSSVISACAKAGDAERALAVYQRMRTKGIQPHIVAYAALARPFAYKGNWQQVERIAADMAADNVPANEYFIYAQLLSYAIARPAQVLRAEACFLEAAANGVRVNDHIHSALARAVGKARCAELVKEVQCERYRSPFVPQPNAFTGTGRRQGAASGA